MNETSVAAPSALFSGFVDLLRAHGFSVSVERQLRMERLLAMQAGAYGPEQLPTLLCPLFAQSLEQQQLFHQLYGVYFERWEAERPEVAPVAAEPVAAVRATGKAESRLRRWWVVAGILLLGVLGVAIWMGRSASRPQASPAAAVPAPAVPAAKEQAPVPPAATPQPETAPPAANTELPAKPVPPVPPLPEASWWEVVFLGGVLAGAAMGAAVLFVRRRTLASELPVSLRVPVARWLAINIPPAGGLFSSEELRPLTKALNERTQSAARQLDIRATVEKTVRDWGYPRLVYRLSSRQITYVGLVERASSRDQWTALHVHLLASLAAEGVVVETFVYDKDPRYCFAPAQREAIPLERLASHYAEARLVVVGSPEGFLDAWSGQPAGWVPVLEAFSRRVLLTTEPVPLALAEWLQPCPPTLEGLSAWARQETCPLPPPEEVPRTVDELRRTLSRRALLWLSACAVYPDLDWNLTLHLGGLRSLPGGTLSAETARELAALPWFRTGKWPEGLRLALLRQLPGAIHGEVRQVLRHLLQRSAPVAIPEPKERQLLLAVQRFWVDGWGLRSLWRVARAFAVVPRSDFTTQCAAELFARTETRRWQWLAPWMGGLTLQGGGVPYGKLAGVVLAAAGLCAGAGVWSVKGWQSAVLTAVERSASTAELRKQMLSEAIAKTQAVQEAGRLFRLGALLVAPADRLIREWDRDGGGVSLEALQRMEMLGYEGKDFDWCTSFQRELLKPTAAILAERLGRPSTERELLEYVQDFQVYLQITAYPQDEHYYNLGERLNRVWHRRFSLDKVREKLVGEQFDRYNGRARQQRCLVWMDPAAVDQARRRLSAVPLEQLDLAVRLGVTNEKVASVGLEGIPVRVPGSFTLAGYKLPVLLPPPLSRSLFCNSNGVRDTSVVRCPEDRRLLSDLNLSPTRRQELYREEYVSRWREFVRAIPPGSAGTVLGHLQFVRENTAVNEPGIEAAFQALRAMGPAEPYLTAVAELDRARLAGKEVAAAETKAQSALQEMLKNVRPDPAGRLDEELRRLLAVPAARERNLQSGIEIETVPAGVTIIALEIPDESCTTPCRLSLPKGQHTLLAYRKVASRNGYEQERRTVSIPSDKKVLWELGKELDTQLGATLGTLVVKSTPAGAAIYIDGLSQSETTPATFPLKPGPHLVELTAPIGRGDSSRWPINVNLKLGSTLTYQVFFGKTADSVPFGFLKLRIVGAQPGDVLTISGREVGTIPESGILEVPTGAGKVRLGLGKRGQAAREIDSNLGGVSERITLDASMFGSAGAAVQINSTTYPAELSVQPVAGGPERKYVLQNETSVRLPEGRYVFRAAAGGRRRSRSAEVKDGRVNTVVLDLRTQVSVGMADWEEPEAWAKQEGWFVRRGGEYVHFGISPVEGTFTFNVSSLGGRTVRWFVNYRDPQNHVLYELDRRRLVIRDVVSGVANAQTIPYEHVGEEDSYTVQVAVQANSTVTQLYSLSRWSELHVLKPVPSRDLRSGSFGFYLPNGARVGLVNFRYNPSSSQ